MRVYAAMDSTCCDGPPSTPCVGFATTRVGEPDAGNLHVRFDEGERFVPAPYSTVDLLPILRHLRHGRDIT